MPIRNLPCAICGKLLYSSRTSLPPGQATCRECRRTEPRPYEDVGTALTTCYQDQQARRETIQLLLVG